MGERFGWQGDRFYIAGLAWCIIAYNKHIKTRYTNIYKD